jgi:hypothetical protein
LHNGFSLNWLFTRQNSQLSEILPNHFTFPAQARGR